MTALMTLNRFRSEISPDGNGIVKNWTLRLVTIITASMIYMIIVQEFLKLAMAQIGVIGPATNIVTATFLLTVLVPLSAYVIWNMITKSARNLTLYLMISMLLVITTISVLTLFSISSLI